MKSLTAFPLYNRSSDQSERKGSSLKSTLYNGLFKRKSQPYDLAHSRQGSVERSKPSSFRDMNRLLSSLSIDERRKTSSSVSFTQEEMDLIRSSWEKVLTDEVLLEDESLMSSFPGSYPSEDSRERNFDIGLRTGRSSLFCFRFYANVLSVAPDLEVLFPLIKHQAVAFAGVLTMAVTQLDNLSSMDAYLEKLGKTHARIIGVEPEMFDMLAKALVQTFFQRLGLYFTLELEIIWTKLYLYLANAILHFGADPIINDDNLITKPSLLYSYDFSRSESKSSISTSDSSYSLATDSATTAASLPQKQKAKKKYEVDISSPYSLPFRYKEQIRKYA